MTARAMQNQTAAYLSSPSSVTLIVYQKEPYQHFAIFVNQSRQEAEAMFKEKYNVEPDAKYEVKEYENVESYSVTEDGNLLTNGSYK
ncbi:hypothetical protein ACFQ4C_21050 [Larkinella insperata]|uniref:Uncharacterized protein n=1 Tax=Larkinella insperata TaxID=332158 RepID=A0ABW3QBG0_9BACT